MNDILYKVAFPTQWLYTRGMVEEGDEEVDLERRIVALQEETSRYIRENIQTVTLADVSQSAEESVREAE